MRYSTALTVFLDRCQSSIGFLLNSFGFITTSLLMWQQLVEQIVTRAVPVIQEFNDFLKVLKPNLVVSDHCLVLLYQRGEQGAMFKEIESWVRPQMRSNLARTSNGLCDRKDLVHFDGSRYFITRLGQKEVEAHHLIEPVV